MDIWPKEKRSKVMSNIRSTDTSPEISVRRMLFSQGYCYRLHVKDLPGKPDIVLPKYNTVIFVHGCFWHLHSGCRDGTIPKTRTEYWREKLFRNKERDKEHMKKLRKQGWHALQIWECEVENKPEAVFERLENFLRKDKS